MEEEAFIEAINEFARVLEQTYGMTEFTVTRSLESEWTKSDRPRPRFTCAPD